MNHRMHIRCDLLHGHINKVYVLTFIENYAAVFLFIFILIVLFFTSLFIS